MKKTKKWEKPKQIIFSRGKSEEGVFVACKWGNSFSSSGPVWEQAMRIRYASPFACGGCSADSPS